MPAASKTQSKRPRLSLCPAIIHRHEACFMQGPRSPWRDDTAGYRPAAGAEGQGDEEATPGKLKICKAEGEAGL